MKNKILITGASGYVGARLLADLTDKHTVAGTYCNNNFGENLVMLDITKLSSVEKVVDDFRPDIIVHNAAFPVAPKDKVQEDLIKQLNYTGVDNIVDVANKFGSRVVFVSSAVALNLDDSYGASKAYGEQSCSRVSAGYLIVRPHTVFGFSPNMTNDRSFNRILKNIYLKTSAAYDTSWKFQPTYIGHISMVIEKYIIGEVDASLVNIAFGDLKTKFDLGSDILKNFDITVDPVDANSSFPIIKLDLSEFEKMNLPIKSYQEMITKIVAEIKGIGKNYPLSNG